MYSTFLLFYALLLMQFKKCQEWHLIFSRAFSFHQDVHHWSSFFKFMAWIKNKFFADFRRYKCVPSLASWNKKGVIAGRQLQQQQSRHFLLWALGTPISILIKGHQWNILFLTNTFSRRKSNVSKKLLLVRKRGTLVKISASF